MSETMMAAKPRIGPPAPMVPSGEAAPVATVPEAVEEEPAAEPAAEEAAGDEVSLEAILEDLKRREGRSG